MGCSFPIGLLKSPSLLWFIINVVFLMLAVVRVLLAAQASSTIEQCWSLTQAGRNNNRPGTVHYEAPSTELLANSIEGTQVNTL